jgi:hypothetical protein
VRKPDPSFKSRMSSSVTACWRWRASAVGVTGDIARHYLHTVSTGWPKQTMSNRRSSLRSLGTAWHPAQLVHARGVGFHEEPPSEAVNNSRVVDPRYAPAKPEPSSALDPDPYSFLKSRHILEQCWQRPLCVRPPDQPELGTIDCLAWFASVASIAASLMGISVENFTKRRKYSRTIPSKVELRVMSAGSSRCTMRGMAA